ncbi:MAG: S9 family peptidase [Deltaproteobacteria bacterium]|nr:S9 family peptidase [Deltaproteobacteria bacterium]MBW2071928.1 S9 family peptidase [Deltaproteobacteria bacterium]
MASTEKVAPYGSWRSPISAEKVARGAVKLGQVALDGQDVYWTESRPAEGGRSVIMRWQPGGECHCITAASFNVRTRVHEYGGGDFVVNNEAVCFVNFSDQRLYHHKVSHEPRQLNTSPSRRYADGEWDHRRQRLILVGEDHGGETSEPVNSLVAVSLTTDGEEQLLAAGNDFYSSPRLSPDGSHLAWLSWNHPSMPWDGTELWLGEIRSDGTVSAPRLIAGGESESIVQPEWSPDGILHFISDRTGWWNLYRYRNAVEALCPVEAEFAHPQWLFGMSTYSFASSRLILCTYCKGGVWYLASLDTLSGTLQDIACPYTDIRNLKANADHLLFIGGSPHEPASVVRLDLETREFTVLKRSVESTIDPSYISTPEPIEFPSEDKRTAFAFYYPPKNPVYSAPAGELPPLLVQSHGGPTSAATTTLSLRIQYWTSRGIAVLDVNYGGSSGYGRAYRQLLNGKWGIVDVQDCLAGARHLVQENRVDGDRLAIRGSSAGGYTTLCAITFHNLFKAAASYYGVSDLQALVEDTHKFESHYLDRLVGPYAEQQDLYRQRSPIHFVEQISCPLILFQGLEDEVVPPNQSEMMAAAVRSKGLPVAYIPFPGEQHGFRRAETIKQALEAELYFYSRIFTFPLGEPIPVVLIDNLCAKL